MPCRSHTPSYAATDPYPELNTDSPLKASWIEAGSFLNQAQSPHRPIGQRENVNKEESWNETFHAVAKRGDCNGKYYQEYHELRYVPKGIRCEPRSKLREG